MSSSYFNIVRLIERLHRHFLDVLRAELRRAQIGDINAVQALLLYNIGEAEVVIRDLKDRGYYYGSNVSYNIKKLTEFGYLDQERCTHDRRSVRLKLTDKGLRLCTIVHELQLHLAGQVEGTDESMEKTSQTMLQIERVWEDYIRHDRPGN